MEPEREKNLEQIVADACGIQPNERQSWLEQNCPESLRPAVISLLDYSSMVESFLRTPVEKRFGGLLFQDNEHFLNKRFGNYRIVREIGRGGMGAVFLGERDDGAFQQRVAIKIIRQSVVDSLSKSRFRSEQQILAALSHPNIAKLFDGGITDEGEPYLVMEFVAGEALSDHINGKQPSIEEKLVLFLKVCSAVSYAHRNLIIHRDLKPSNIMVRPDGEPVLLDFGLAKILDPAAGSEDRTQTRFLALTPNYASPEQFEGKNVSTLADVYSLGVVLYELLTERPPFSLHDKELNDILEIVNYREPMPLGSLSIADASRIKGDLDVIVLKALRKSPENRYESVEKLAEDLERYLNGLPILARPATNLYRTAKFLRRNKLGVAAAAAVGFSLLGGIAATVRQSRRANRHRVAAEKRFSEVRELANSFLFEVYPKIEQLKGSTEAKEEVVRIALKYLDNLSAEAAGDRDLLRELSVAYQKIGDVQGNPSFSHLGDMKGALSSYEKAGSILSKLLDTDDSEPELLNALASNLQAKALILWWLDATGGALATFDEALLIRRSLAERYPDSKEFSEGLIRLQLRQGEIPWWEHRIDEALEIYGEAVDHAEELVRKRPGDKVALGLLADCLTAIGVVYNDLLEFETAERCYLRAESILKPLCERNPEDYVLARSLYSVYNRFAELHIIRRDGRRTEHYSIKGIELIEGLAATDSRDLWSARHLSIGYTNLGQARYLNGDYMGSIESFELAMEIVGKLKDSFPENERLRNYALCHREIGKAQVELGLIDASLASHEIALEAYRKIMAATTSGTLLNDLAEIHRLLGRAYIAKGDVNSARWHYDKAISVFERLRKEGSMSELDKRDASEVIDEYRSHFSGR
ncbi:MAG: protein kinase [Acidobacteriota bacterium]|nr:MAG: protein kinase [Acidobacteriota bacterium]